MAVVLDACAGIFGTLGLLGSLLAADCLTGPLGGLAYLQAHAAAGAAGATGSQTAGQQQAAAAGGPTGGRGPLADFSGAAIGDADDALSLKEESIKVWWQQGTRVRDVHGSCTNIVRMYSLQGAAAYCLCISCLSSCAHSSAAARWCQDLVLLCRITQGAAFSTHPTPEHT